VNARAEYLAQQDGKTIGGAKMQFKTAEDARKYFTTGKGADAFRQQETIIHHADLFKQVFQAMDSGNVQLANRLANEAGLQLGDDKAANARIVGTFLAEEVGKYVSGGQSSAEEREKITKLIPDFSSPQRAIGGLTTLQGLVEGQRKSWTKQRDAALKGAVPGAGEEPGHGDGGKWSSRNPAGSPDMKTLGKNSRFKSAVWVGQGAPDGAGWYVKEGGMIRRVE